LRKEVDGERVDHVLRRVDEVNDAGHETKKEQQDGDDPRRPTLRNDIPAHGHRRLIRDLSATSGETLH